MHKFSDFNKLYTFTIAAEYLSFSKAAAQLFITQAAVSQQIRNLEDNLGFRLFHRVTRGLTLTREGERLMQVATRPLEKIQTVTEELRKDEPSGVLTVSILPSLAMKWLIPRLDKFNSEYPDINIHVHSHNELADFKADGVDMAVRFGYKYGEEDELYDVRLMQEEVFLVASPKLATKEKPLNEINDLYQHVLLHDETDCHYDAYGINAEIKWQVFSELLGVDDKKCKSITLTGAHLVLQAAIEGQGVAITRSVLAQDDLDAGRLVRLFEDASVASPGYHIVYPKHFVKRRKIKVFEQFLLNEAKDQG